jgi:hypothetical protein
MPEGVLNRAAFPVASTLPEWSASPARVVTTQFVPFAVTFRTVKLNVSVT